MENFDRENIEIRQICQYFPHQNFAPYGMYVCMLNKNSLVAVKKAQPSTGGLKYKQLA